MAATVDRRDAYIGEKKNQLRNGFGVYVYENKFFKYEGEWKDGKKHGHGKLTMADGTYYEGEFTNGEIQGHGFKFFAINGNTYSGQFEQGELHGQGVMNYKDNSAYEGEWFRNVRQGYGVYRCPDNSIYQGYLHNNLRHGEGTQIYTNGDRYDGDWVKDKRQGHGEFRTRDGTRYSGQWHNHLYNGEGTMNHSSGMYYQGLWVNGKPAIMADKLSFGTEDALEVVQGIPFKLEVVTLNEEGVIVPDIGREIQITAGFKNILPPKEEPTASKENSSSGLFDVIEDVEEQPIPTPFGYSIVPYPLTDQFPYEENDEIFLSVGSRANTMLSDGTGTDEGISAKEAKKAKEEEGKEVDTSEKEATESTEPTTDEGQTVSDPQDSAKDEQTVPGAVIEAALPPPVSNRRSEEGKVVFENLVLAAAPPMYRPFTNMDEAEKNKPPKSRASKRSDDEPGSRPVTRSKTSLERLGDERFARAGEYVIMAQDVTVPPFFEQKPEPAFLLVRVIVPKKPKVKKQKEKAPKWDTSKHIAASMARGYTDIAVDEEANLTAAQ